MCCQHDYSKRDIKLEEGACVSINCHVQFRCDVEKLNLGWYLPHWYPKLDDSCHLSFQYYPVSSSKPRRAKGSYEARTLLETFPYIPGSNYGPSARICFRNIALVIELIIDGKLMK
jgi:hypothetical protein